jgi:Lysophospholipase L1 and related esterases
MERRKIFVIGDSISIHYGPYLKDLVDDKFDYDRKRGVEQALADLDKPVGANAGDSRMVLEYLREEERKGIRFDILLIGCGLHDIRVDRLSSKIQVEPEEYRKNLQEIVMLLKRISCRVVWIGFTPVVDWVHNSRDDGFLRFSKDVQLYDSIAKHVMMERNIPYVDLHSFTQNLGEDIYSDHVHFKEDIRRLQAAYIAGYLDNLCSSST